MSKFDVLIEWDDVNGESEKEWVKRLLGTMRGPEELRFEADDYSRKMAMLRRDSADFEALNLNIEMTDVGLRLYAEQGQETGKGDIDNAALFIACFLEHWRPRFAVRIDWTSLDAVGRRTKGSMLVGPAGITSLKGYKSGKRCA